MGLVSGVCLGYYVLTAYFSEDSPRLIMGRPSRSGFPSQSRQSLEMQVDSHVVCPSLLSNLKQRWNVSTHFNKSVERFLRVRNAARLTWRSYRHTIATLVAIVPNMMGCHV
jgi:hypothetical protein